ncbi:MAG: hypothetical protein V4613_10125 [Bacteroidota bacterium]
MKEIKSIKSIFFILFMAIFQPFFDVLALFQYGPSSKCLDYFILQQTYQISLLYIALPLILIYLLFKLFNYNQLIVYVLMGILFAIIAFYKISIPLFTDRIAAWSTFEDYEIAGSAFMTNFPTLIIQVAVMTIILYRINVEKKSVQ